MPASAAPPTTEPGPASPVAARVREFAALAVSLLVLLTFLAAIAIAYAIRNDTLLTALLSIAGANATTVVGYWLGSSDGSAKKTTLLTAAAAVPPNPANAGQPRNPS
jgi:hypothetical protein